MPADVVATTRDRLSGPGRRGPSRTLGRGVAATVVATSLVAAVLAVTPVPRMACAGSGEYCEVWRDDFDGPAGAPPDPQLWTAETGGGGWGNDERQVYTADSSNVALSGTGNLLLTARRETTATGASYTSARITTRGKSSFTYGRLTARVNVPEGQGVWPALWLLGDTISEVGYPGSGEIDALEVPDTATVLHATVHGPRRGDPTAKWQRGTNIAVSPSLAAGWHEYGVIKRPGSVEVTLDGSTVLVVTPADLTADEAWVFEQPFHVLLNIAVGGTFAGDPDTSDAFPATMQVDWMRLEERR